jgi:Kef-type K+ transport system membrane component KefB
MVALMEQMLSLSTRLLGGDGGSDFGVHIAYDDLWFAMVYLCAIYTVGFLFEHILFCPSLVGQIAAGILLGPQLANIVPYTEAFVLLGEIGLVLLVIEAGVDIDVTTLKLIGKRGVIIATLGSIFPIAIGLGIAYALGADTKAAIAAGASFGPTSLGIAMNILRSGKIINTPTGQLIVAAAIIDDMIALIILSQLGGLVGEITISGVLIPIVSALCFLLIGGYMALFVLPGKDHTSTVVETVLDS